MECDKFTIPVKIEIPGIGTIESKDLLLKVEVDEAIAELKAERDAFEKSLNEMTESFMQSQRALWLARAERYKMKEFIAREEATLRDQIAWSQYLRKRTYNQWVDQLLRIANLANKLQNKCRAKAEEYK